ncbi:hypothetical protein HZ992_15415 [Rhizobacter sp. AJA081-3]|uniref:hypothetical protein n=1 Tax=Rhizobacter sp. AJA081-3 TaxID=2753607 RepID=UPI001ADFC2D1|nr:hypothetical protein [Rhizobacter sp. AJA081-3]QTN21567.1 hypothetical protein HZ992_15415 [Rhizobacter sp. AJA081-3]
MTQPTAPLPPEVLEAFGQRRPIEAIRLLLANRASLSQKVRPQPGPSATTPKPISPPSSEPISPAGGLSPGEVPNSSSAFWDWVVVALLAYLAYRLVQG